MNKKAAGGVDQVTAEAYGKNLEANIQALAGKLKQKQYRNYYNVPGNLSALWRFYSWAEACVFKWLNRRGGKPKSFTLKVFTKAIDLLGIAKPKIRVVNRQH